MLDRELQLTILQVLRPVYPEWLGQETFPSRSKEELDATLSYLAEHGLLELNVARYKGISIISSAKITAAGLDFLADDGGLSAILGVVTVRFDDETIKALLIDRIKNEEGDQTVKNKLIAEVKNMPSNTLKIVGEKAISYGIASAPAGLTTLGVWLGVL